jgi:hypothetical protein
MDEAFVSLMLSKAEFRNRCQDVEIGASRRSWYKIAGYDGKHGIVVVEAEMKEPKILIPFHE